MFRLRYFLLISAFTVVLSQDCPVDPDLSCYDCVGNYNAPLFIENSVSHSDAECDVTLTWNYPTASTDVSPRMTFTCSYDDGSLCTGAEVDLCASCTTVTFTGLHPIRNPLIAYSDTCGNLEVFPVAQACTVEPTTTGHPQGCRNAYEFIGNKCYFVDPFFSGNWDEADFFCSQVGGNELAIIKDDENYLAILDHIYDNGLNGSSYWIGGLDPLLDGNFTWIDGTAMTMGTPYWAPYGYAPNMYAQEPTDVGALHNDCVQMDGTRAHYFDDADCLLVKAVICEQTNVF